mgnify:CR=1 FL=1
MKKLAQYVKTPLLLITLIDGFEDASFGLILIVYISRIAEPWWLTVMAVGGFFTGILFGPFTGWVADRFSGRTCWSGSLAVSALCVAVIAFLPHPVTIVGCRRAHRQYFLWARMVQTAAGKRDSVGWILYRCRNSAGRAGGESLDCRSWVPGRRILQLDPQYGYS